MGGVFLLLGAHIGVPNINEDNYVIYLVVFFSPWNDLPALITMGRLLSISSEFGQCGLSYETRCLLKKREKPHVKQAYTWFALNEMHLPTHFQFAGRRGMHTFNIFSKVHQNETKIPISMCFVVSLVIFLIFIDFTEHGRWQPLGIIKA